MPTINEQVANRNEADWNNLTTSIRNGTCKLSSVEIAKATIRTGHTMDDLSRALASGRPLTSSPRPPSRVTSISPPASPAYLLKKSQAPAPRARLTSSFGMHKQIRSGWGPSEARLIKE